MISAAGSLLGSLVGSLIGSLLDSGSGVLPSSSGSLVGSATVSLANCFARSNKVVQHAFFCDFFLVMLICVQSVLGVFSQFWENICIQKSLMVLYLEYMFQFFHIKQF